MKFAIIQSLLDAHLQTLSNLPKLQLENTKNIGETGKPFSRAVLLPATPEFVAPIRLSMPGEIVYTGLYQVDLFYPLDKGSLTANQMADAVMAHFSRGLLLFTDGVSVEIGIARREAAFRSEPFYHLPVSVPWSCSIESPTVNT